MNPEENLDQRLTKLEEGLTVIPVDSFNEAPGENLEENPEGDFEEAPGEEVYESAGEPASFEERLAQLESGLTVMPVEHVFGPQQPKAAPPQAVDVEAPNSLMAGLPGMQAPTPPSPLQSSLSDRYNTVPQRMAEGLNKISELDWPHVGQLLANEYMSMSETGIVLDPMDRVNYARSVMANDSLRSDIKAQLVDQAMRDGKIMPEALPKVWYEARGLKLLPGDMTAEKAVGIQAGQQMAGMIQQYGPGTTGQAIGESIRGLL